MLWSYHDVQAGHFRRYTRKSLIDIFKRTNFRISFSSYFFSFLVLPNLLLRAIPTKLGLVKNYDDKKTKQSQHVNVNSMKGKIISALLSREIKKIKKNKTIKFGNSLIIVATKPL